MFLSRPSAIDAIAHQALQMGACAELQALDQALAVMVCSVDGSILRANANFLQLSGYKARELVGLPRTVLLPRGDVDAAVNESADAVAWAAVLGGAAEAVECDQQRKDGSIIRVRFQHTPITDADGQVAEVVSFATDVTDASRQAADCQGQISAINGSQAVVHFALDGSITDANQRFLRMTGYGLDDLVGRHHHILVEPSTDSNAEPDPAQSAASQAFWQALARGEHQAGTYRRRCKDGRELWLQATYNPILDLNGRPFKVVQYATDVTADRRQRIDHEAQLLAIAKSHATITFDMNGIVLEANPNFLAAMGYRIDEVEGRHHRMFVEPSFAHGPEYARFWGDLAEGRHRSGEYRRFDKQGREIWLQASYNPIHDANGKPCKVVKYAAVITRDKLRQADHQGQVASIHKAQCVVSFELDGTVIDANDNFLDATGYRLSDVRGHHHRMFVDDATADSAEYQRFWSDLARGRHRAGEFKRIGQDGREIWLQASYNPILDMNGRPFKVVKYATDITRERLRQADNDGQIAAIHRSQCVVEFDMDGIICSANDNFLSAMGCERHEVEGRHHRHFVDPAHADGEHYRAFWDTLRSGRFVAEKCRRLGKGGRTVWFQASYNPILDLNGRPFKVIKIATDVTADVALAADFIDARRQAHHDAATALPNRMGLTRFMTKALAGEAGRLAVLYLDLDHFKPINDTFGHHIGDLVLRETAKRLREVAGPDQIVARIGGDEFVIAAPDLSEAQIDVFCRHLIAVVQTPIRHDKFTLTVGLSIGVAVSPHDATTAEDLLRCADVALYRSKGHGRGTYSFFAAHMDEKLSADRHLAEEMRHGIKAGQFFLDYQPRFDAQTRQVRGALALVRWDHPASERLAPADFLALAEKSGLIVPLGEWVLRHAARAAAAWPGIVLSVKVSPIELAGTDLAQRIAAVLAESGLAPQRLELDLSERALIDDADVHARLMALKALGVRLSLDDYGDHHASLDELRAFPFDSVKIDQRFIADIEGETDGRRIVRDILRIGQTLADPVAARDLEADGRLLMLSLDGRAEVQGFLLGRARPAEALTPLLQGRAAAEATLCAEPQADESTV